MTTGTTYSTQCLEEPETGMDILVSVTSIYRISPSFNLSERSPMQESKYTYSPEGVMRFERKQKNGYVIIASPTIFLRCVGPMIGQMIICLKCGGWKKWEYNAEYASYSRIETVSLEPGEIRDISACKCVPETFDSEPNAVAVPSEVANTYQVGGAHYKSAVQHWDYVVANEIPYLEAMVIKYLTRWRKKNGSEDVRKAFHFLQKLAEVEGIDLNPPSPSVRQAQAEPAGAYPSRKTGQGRAMDAGE